MVSPARPHHPFRHRLCQLGLTLLAFSSFHPGVEAALRLPTGLNHADQVRVLRLLAPGTRPRIHSSPYPLGGYAGVDIGIAYDTLIISDLGSVGSGAQSQDSYGYTNLSLGKGLYHNIDVFINFMPNMSSENISTFGATVRWAFYFVPDLPLLLSAVTFGNSSNINDQLIMQNTGVGLTAALYTRPLTLHVTFGRLFSSGIFLGSTASLGLTASQQIERASSIIDYLSLGATFTLDQYYWGILMDQGESTVYGAMIGVRL